MSLRRDGVSARLTIPGSFCLQRASLAVASDKMVSARRLLPSLAPMPLPDAILAGINRFHKSVLKLRRIRSEAGLAASAGLGALLCGLAAPAAFAQQTTASLRGVTVDDAGAPVKGATINVVHTPSGTKSTVISDAAGTFDARGLRVGGPYKVI
eukprot:gene19160-23158_t